MSIYKVKTAGHGLVPTDLLFGGEYLTGFSNYGQMRFKVYDELGADKGFVFLPRSWFLANVELSIEEDDRDSDLERGLRQDLRHHGGGRSGSSSPPVFRHGPVSRTSPPPLSEEDRLCDERGRLYEGNPIEFTKAVNQWLGTLVRGHTSKLELILLSDRMSGDARLVGLYASYKELPILYIVTRSKLGRTDFGARYLQELGLHLFKFAADDAHVTYSQFNLPLGCLVRKGAKMTKHVAGLLNKPAILGQPHVPSGEQFRTHARSALHVPRVPPGLEPMLKETCPVCVVWTKARAVPTLFKGRPEHLLGNTGTLQVCQLARTMGFKVAIAGDLAPKPALQTVIDYDLRYTAGALKGLSMREQYGVLQFVNVYVPLIHIAMRSGNVEPLPLLGMRTVYLEEEGNPQTERMLQWARATHGFYERHVFTVPPTLKGRMRELVTYFFEYPFRQSVKGRPAEREMMRLLNVLIRDHLGIRRSPFESFEQIEKDLFVRGELWKFFSSITSGEHGDDPFVRLKSVTRRVDFPRGFNEIDLRALEEKLGRLRVEAMVLLALGRINAIKAVTGL